MTRLLIMGGATLVVALLTAGATAVRSVNRLWLRSWIERDDDEPRAGAALRRSTQASAHDGAHRSRADGRSRRGRVALLNVGDPQRLLLDAAVLALLVLTLGQLVPRAIARRWAARSCRCSCRCSARSPSSSPRSARLRGTRHARGAHVRAALHGAHRGLRGVIRRHRGAAAGWHARRTRCQRGAGDHLGRSAAQWQDGRRRDDGARRHLRARRSAARPTSWRAALRSPRSVVCPCTGARSTTRWACCTRSMCSWNRDRRVPRCAPSPKRRRRNRPASCCTPCCVLGASWRSCARRTARWPAW
jgi:hypothetical protein